LVCLLILFPNSYMIIFWEFYFLPFSVHVQTRCILCNLTVSVAVVFFINCIFVYWLISSNFPFILMYLAYSFCIQFLSKVFICFLSLLVSKFLMHMYIIVFFSLSFNFSVMF
jgi:hypothetical protein